MEDLIFATVFGFATYCCMCCAIAKSRSKTTVSTALTDINDEEIQISTGSTDLWEPTETVEASETVKSIDVTEVAATKTQLNIDLDKLPLAVCRKIASRLNKTNLAISQSVNGKSKPVSQLRAEIKNRASKAPETMVPIITELAPVPTPASKNITSIPRIASKKKAYAAS